MFIYSFTQFNRILFLPYCSELLPGKLFVYFIRFVLGAGTLRSLVSPGWNGRHLCLGCSQYLRAWTELFLCWFHFLPHSGVHTLGRGWVEAEGKIDTTSQPCPQVYTRTCVPVMVVSTGKPDLPLQIVCRDA